MVTLRQQTLFSGCSIGERETTQHYLLRASAGQARNFAPAWEGGKTTQLNLEGNTYCDNIILPCLPNLVKTKTPETISSVCPRCSPYLVTQFPNYSLLTPQTPTPTLPRCQRLPEKLGKWTGAPEIKVALRKKGRTRHV